MDPVIRLFTLFIYTSLLYELIMIPVPSVASTYQLLFTKDNMSQGTLLTKVRNWSPTIKVAFLIVPTVFVVLVYLVPLALAIWPPIQQIFHLISLPQRIWVYIIGAFVALIGRVVGLHAAWHMHYEVNDKRPLKTSGLFSLSRNPILLGMYFTFIGLWLLYPTWEMGIGFILFISNMHFRILLEEDFLSWQFGSAYQAFAARTRRYL